jgi:hypothetical protein
MSIKENKIKQCINETRKGYSYNIFLIKWAVEQTKARRKWW